MKIIFTVQEPPTFFHILDSLSQWDFHTRKPIQKYYKKRFGLSSEDKQFIEKYTKIRKEHGWGDLDSNFYPCKNFKQVETKLKEKLNKRELGTIKKVINHFYNNLHILYLESKIYLEKRKIILEKEAKKYHLNAIIKEIAKFYKSVNYPKKVYVHLVASPNKWKSGGGANIFPKKHITLEPQNIKKSHSQDIQLDLCVVIHEILHILEDNVSGDKWKKVKERLEKNKLDFWIFREAIADTLVPEGVLAIKYGLLNKEHIPRYKNKKIPSGNSDKYQYFRNSRFKLSALIYNLTKDKIRDKKSIFEGDYLKKCVNEYVKMIKNISLE